MGYLAEADRTPQDSSTTAVRGAARGARPSFLRYFWPGRAPSWNPQPSIEPSTSLHSS
jgi:hypothetical protein